MKRVILISIAFLFVAVFSFELISKDPGYVIVSYRNSTYEMTLWFALFCVVAILIGFRLIYRLFRKIYDSIASSVSWLSENKTKTATRRTREGMVHFLEGNWRDAKRNLMSAAKHTEAPLLHYLASARSAFELGDTKETERLLLEAQKIAPENSLSVLLSQARLLLADKKYQESLDVLQKASKQSPNHPVVIDLLRQNYWALRDWSSLIDLLPSLRNAQVMGDEHLAAFEKDIFSSYLKSLSHAEQASVESYQKAWKSLPKKLSTDEQLIAEYVGLLLRANMHDEAESVLRSSLKKVWSSNLAGLYGKALSSKPREQMSVAEKWLREHPDDAPLLATLGRLSVRNELWGKARDYFEISLRFQEKPEIYAELAKLFAQLGEHEKSTSLYQKGLLLSTATH